MEQNITQNLTDAPVIPAVTPQAPVASKINLDQLVNLCVEKEASDIHFGESSRVALRVSGKLVFIENIPSLTHENANEMILSMLTNEDEKKRLERVREIDLSYTHVNGVGFRVNIFYKHGKLAAVMRMISKHVSTMEDLGTPECIRNLLQKREGLILICGTAGGGKSTTIQGMVQYINENFVHHVITIENPIEHIFEENNSIISQREIGKDTLSIPNALRSAQHEDPNVIVVHEISDFETLDNILTVVETGHLVIASLPTKNTLQTIERLINMSPQVQQDQIRDRLSDNILGILSQDLVTRQDQPGRMAVYEAFINIPNAKNIIKHGNLSQLKTVIQSGAEQGMITIDAYVSQLVQQGVITKEEADRFLEQ